MGGQNIGLFGYQRWGAGTWKGCLVANPQSPQKFLPPNDLDPIFTQNMLFEAKRKIPLKICLGVDACQGDSGGPASVLKGGRHTLVISIIFLAPLTVV